MNEATGEGGSKAHQENEVPNMLPPFYSKLPEKFWSKVADTPGKKGCWLWIAGLTSNGYGRFRLGKQVSRAHRFSLADASGLPDGLFALHKCDVRACVNPAHLYAGTVQNNSDDMVRRGRASKNKGVANGQGKLTDSKVLEIRRLYANGGHTQRSLAAKFGVDHSYIGRIVRRTAWTHV